MNSTDKLVIHTDGGARGNPGPAGIGVVIKDETGLIIFQHGAYIGEATNNFAEYQALIVALRKAKELGASQAHVFMDSELIVRQMHGKYKIKEPSLQRLAAEVFQLQKHFQRVIFTHVARQRNKEADALVNQAIDQALLTERPAG
jgi:ribonuclease HI